jgi:hypothetical protein
MELCDPFAQPQLGKDAVVVASDLPGDPLPFDERAVAD